MVSTTLRLVGDASPVGGVAPGSAGTGMRWSSIHTICVPVDGLPEAAAALRPAQALAARLDAELLLVHAGRREDDVRAGMDGVVDTARARGLRARAVSVATPAVPPTTQESAGWLVSVLREYDAGIVVAGMQDVIGAGSLTYRGALDPMAEALLTQSPVPTLLVGSRYGSRAGDGALRWMGWEGTALAARQAGHPTAPLRLLVAVDGSAAAGRALAAAADLAQSLAAQVSLVRVVPSGSVLYCARGGAVAGVEVAEQYLHGAAVRLQQAGVAPDAIRIAVRMGGVAEQLVAQAAREQASILVIGNGDTTPLSVRLGGSVTATVVREAPLPVLVVPA